VRPDSALCACQCQPILCISVGHFSVGGLLVHQSDTYHYMPRRARISETVEYHHNVTKPSIKTMAPEPDQLRNFDNLPGAQAVPNIAAALDRAEQEQQRDNTDRLGDTQGYANEHRRKGKSWQNRNNHTSQVFYSYG